MLSLLSGTFAALAIMASRASADTFPYIQDLVSFGDSYTDEGRLSYFIAHQGAPPPVGYTPPVNNATASGGYIWPRIVADLTGITLHDYAVSGAVCSNELTPRYCSCIPGLFPSVQDYEIPAFLADYQVTTKFGKSLKLDPEHTMFSIWIGTNDLGNGAILTDEHEPNVTLVNITDCVIDAVVRLYDNGARNFIFQNVAPLQLAPQYATPQRNGVSGPNHYFPTKDSFLNGNLTAISDRMQELVLSTNQIWKYQLPAVAQTLPEAKIAYFDSYNIILDVINNPHQFLTAPYNVTGYESHCTISNDCATSYIYDPSHPNGYVWYDELHPSQRTDTVIAEEFVKAIHKESQFATYYF